MKKKLASITIGVLCMMLMCFPQSVFAENTVQEALEVKPGYNYARFKDDNITINVYNWGEYISNGNDGDSLDVISAFTQLTGIKVNYTNFATNEELYAKLKSGGAQYDVIMPSDYMVGKLIKEDMLAPLDFTQIPNFSMIGEAYKNRDYDKDNEYSVPYLWGMVGLIYNTTLVEQEIDSWQVLWDEAYANNILMFDNSRDSFAIALKKEGYSLNPNTIKQVDIATAELKNQRSVVQAYVMDQIFDKMEGGEAAVAPYYSGDALTMMEENPDLKFVYPKEGTNYFVDAMCIPKDAHYKQAAEMFINFMCETQVALANCEAVGYSTPQIEAQKLLPIEIRENPIAYPSQSILENSETFNVLPDDINEYMDLSWSNIRSYSEDSGGWLMVVFLVLAVGLVIWNGIRQYKKNKKEY